MIAKELKKMENFLIKNTRKVFKKKVFNCDIIVVPLQTFDILNGANQIKINKIKIET